MTSTALARPTAGALTSSSLTQEQVALVKRQLMASKREPTDDELALFIHQCDRTGLDPFSRQIYAIYRKDGNGVERMGIQVSIDGLRLIADRTGKYAPGNSYWCGSDGVWRDVWLDAETPAAARVTVRKLVGNQLTEFSAPAKWAEYKPSYDGAGLWRKMPTLMLAKCSEALALRKAFPNETSGLYTSEEMAQADVADETTIVDEVRTAFNATEEQAPPAQPLTHEDVSAAAPEPAVEPTVDADAPVTEQEAGKMLEYFTQVGAPESFWRMGLMTLGFESLTELNKGQAHALMHDAKARFGG